MNHLFIPYELALLAKEKGFNEECCTYFLNKELQRLDGFGIQNETFDDDDIRIAAPLYQQMVDWLRIKHKIVVVIEPYQTPIKTKKGLALKTAYAYKLYTHGKLIVRNEFVFYSSALDKGIEEAFKLL